MRSAQSPRLGAVLGCDRPVVEPDLQERHPRTAAPRDGGVVVADAVVGGPPRERQHRGGEACGDPGQATPPRCGGEERNENRGQEDLVRGPDQDEDRDAEPQCDEPPGARPPERPREHERPEREARGEDGVARGLVVERRPGGIDEEEHRRGERRDTPEDERRCAPRDHADREEHAEHDLEHDAPPDRHRQPDDERRQRRPEELHLRERRVAVEVLEVVDEVVPRVSALRHRPAERLEPEDGERDREQRDSRAPRRHEGQQLLHKAAHGRRLPASRRTPAAAPRSRRATRASSSAMRSP